MSEMVEKLKLARGEPVNFTWFELAACAEREVKMRCKVYGRSDRQVREIAMMRAIAEHFRELERQLDDAPAQPKDPWDLGV